MLEAVVLHHVMLEAVVLHHVMLEAVVLHNATGSIGPYLRCKHCCALCAWLQHLHAGSMVGGLLAHAGWPGMLALHQTWK